MKKIFLSTAVFAAIAFILAGCLKDKGFDDHSYGINDPDTQPPGVGFLTGAKARNDFGLDVTAGTQNVTGLLYVKLLAAKASTSPITLSVADKTTELTAAYNAANSLPPASAVLVLPTSLYTAPASIVIPAGATGVETILPITNTTGLNSNRLYALGLSITGADGGYKVADNQKNMFIVFSVKNQYDGKYTLKGQFYHPSGAPDYPLFTTTVELHTTGPNSVKMFWPLAGVYCPPMWYGGAFQYFGSQEPEIVVNQATNSIVVNNSFPGAVTIYQMGIGYNNLGYSSRWDPAAKTFFACWGYGLGATGTFTPAAASRMWIDTLIRTGPR